MSFFLTTDQMRAGTKTVTRRLGWAFLKPGDLIRAVVKCQGLKPGQKAEPIGVIRVLDVRRESLGAMEVLDDGYGAAEVAAEGFPDMTPTDFVLMFRRSHPNGPADDMVTRIAFEHVPEGAIVAPPRARGEMAGGRRRRGADDGTSTP